MTSRPGARCPRARAAFACAGKFISSFKIYSNLIRQRLDNLGQQVYNNTRELEKGLKASPKDWKGFSGPMKFWLSQKGMFPMSESVKTCTVCGKELELSKSSYAMGSHLFADRFHVDIYTCPQCGHVELFAAKAELVNCPKCGTPHPANEKCPICALDTVLDGKYGR